MRLYIIRHGDPDYTNDSLTPDGHKEAEALAERLAAEGLDKIYVSPLGRARETMEYTQKRLNLSSHVEHWTKELWPELAVEIDGYSDCWMAIDVPGEVFRGSRRMPTHEDWHVIEAFKNSDFLTIYSQLKKDSDAFLARHGFVREGGRYRVSAPNQDKIAVFCHNGFGLTWLAHLLELPVTLVWSGFWLPPSSVTTLLFDQRSEQYATPRCIGLGDVSHLYKSGLPVKPRGIITNFY